jgi:hypothetical protein
MPTVIGLRSTSTNSHFGISIFSVIIALPKLRSLAPPIKVSVFNYGGSNGARISQWISDEIVAAIV